MRNDTSLSYDRRGRHACAPTAGPEDCEDISGTYLQVDELIVVVQTDCGLEVTRDGRVLPGNVRGANVTMYNFGLKTTSEKRVSGSVRENGDIYFTDEAEDGTPIVWTKSDTLCEDISGNYTSRYPDSRFEEQVVVTQVDCKIDVIEKMETYPGKVVGKFVKLEGFASGQKQDTGDVDFDDGLVWTKQSVFNI